MTPRALNWIETFITGYGYEFVLPEDGAMVINQWQGTGYIQHYQSGSSGSMGMIIYGGYLGGQCTITGTLQAGMVITQTFQAPFDQQGDKSTPKSNEPVDMATGAFLYENTDLAIGLPEPLGLRFKRFYNSSSHYRPGVLGYGWTHNYEMSVGARSNGDPALGKRGASDVAAAIVYAHIALDLLKNQQNVQGWTVTTLATQWAMDQMIDNALTVSANAKTYEYIKLPDGSFNPPPGVKASLTADGSGYHLQEGFGTRFDFDTGGRVTTWKDAHNNTLAFAYDGGGKLQTVASNMGVTLTLTYSGNRLTSVGDSAGRLITYTYAVSDLVTYRDAMNNPWAYGYDAAHHLISMTAPLGQVLVTNVYDAFGRVITQTDALTHTTTFYFSGYRNVERGPDGAEVTHYFGNQASYMGRQDPQGNRSTFAYDGQGRRTETTGRLNDTITYTYHNGAGQVASITNAQGHTITYTYAARTLAANSINSAAATFTDYDLTRIDYPDGTNEQFTYNANGDVLASRDRKGQEWRYEYNSRGQTTKIILPTSGEILYTYNADGTLAASKDSGTLTTTYTYDGYKRLARIVQPDASFIQFTYDLNDRMTSIRNENGQTYTITYDANGNRIRLTDPAGKYTQYTPDDMGQIAKITDPLGKITNAVYDSRARLASVTDPNGNATQYHYDNRGWLAELVDGEGKSWRWTYDNERTLKSTVTPMGRTTAFGYNEIGWMTAITDSMGSSSSLAYDSHGRLTVMSDRVGRQTAYTYDNNGLLQSITRSGIGTATFARNSLGLVTQLTDWRGKNWSYGYTPVGRLESYTDTLGNRWGYAYNDRGMLSQSQLPDRRKCERHL